MKTEYEGIEISYIEGTNDWHFELRGRSRITDSLAKAKEAIDKEPVAKRVSFPRFDCYMWKYRTLKIVTVTSVAELDYSGKPAFWVTERDGKKERSKESAYSLFPVTDHNTALLAQIKNKEAEGEVIDKAIGALKQELTIAKVPESIQ